MPLNDDSVAQLAAAVLDGTPIDWAAAEAGAGGGDRGLIDQFKLLSALADLHRPAGSDPSAVPAHAADVDGADISTAIHDRQSSDMSGEVVGAYRLSALLGRGGMGEVYGAARVDGRFDQQVAVKLVKRGMDTGEILRRFARERRILARLAHPGVARLLDAGEASDGRPYFVMERVEGEKLTDYCRTRRLTIEDRLRLVAVCCDAVDAAHRGLVVHRDLKPSNILVTSDGHVKLLDFGVAKLLGDGDDDTQLTGMAGRMLTAGYAAPEQILGGEITVATDVFAMGVLLYELLTDALPFERRSATPYELAARVERETAERPSLVAARELASFGPGMNRHRWVRRLRGDLDAIAMVALAHDPSRRYPSAAALAADLRRYLRSEPIAARPDSAGYRIRKFAMRHRLGVASAAAIAVAVVAALVVSLYETAAARREARRAAAAQAFLTSLFQPIDPARYVGSAPTVRDLVERGSERLDRDLADQPELRADMEALLGQVFDQLSIGRQGEALWRRALATRQTLYGPRDARTIKAKKGITVSLARQLRFAEAEPLFEQLLEDEQRLGDRHELGSVLLNYGNMKRLAGDHAKAEVLLQRAVTLLDLEGEGGRQSLVAALGNLGNVYWQQRRWRDAAAVFERALAIQVKDQGAQSSRVAQLKRDLSNMYAELREFDSAQRYAEEALAVGEKLFPPNDPFIALTLGTLGHISQRRGDRAQARALLGRSIEAYERSKPDDFTIAYSLRDMAVLLLEDGDTQQALHLYERALAVRRKAYGDRHRDVAESWHDVARTRLMLGDDSGAIEAARRSVDTFRSTVPNASAALGGALLVLGDALRRTQHPREALPYLEEAAGIWRTTPPDTPRDAVQLDTALAATRAALR